MGLYIGTLHLTPGIWCLSEAESVNWARTKKREGLVDTLGTNGSASGWLLLMHEAEF